MIFNKTMLFLFLSLVFQSLLMALPQDGNENRLILNSGDTVTVQPLKLSEVSGKIEDVSSLTNKLNDKIKDKSEIESIDSVITQKKLIIDSEKENANKNPEGLTAREIEDLERKWIVLNKQLKSFQQKLNKKTKDLLNEKDFLLVTLKTWELTNKTIKEQKGPPETIARINEEIALVKVFSKKINSRLNQISKVQNNITDLILIAEKNLTELHDLQLNWQSEYLVKDSPAIWAWSDSTKTDSMSTEKRVSVSIGKNSRSIRDYFSEKTEEALYLQLFLLVLLTVVFFNFNKKLRGMEIPVEDTRMQNVRFFTSYYFISAWMLTVLISIWIYPDRPRPVNELIVFLLLIPSIYLYERLLTKKLKPYIIPIVVLFLLDKAQLFVDLNDFAFRVLLLLKSLVTIWMLYVLVSPNKPIRKELHGKWWDFVYKTSYIFLGISSVSFIANVFGYVNLAKLLSNVSTYGILIGILLSLEIGIAISFLIMVFQSSFLKGLNLVKNHQQLIEKRVSLFLRVFALFLWLRSISTSLGIRGILSEWFSGILESSWTIGSVNISFGGMITFFIVIIVASLLAKIMNTVLEEELFPRIELPRGIPGAISMVVRYFIIGWGIYIALESANIDLSGFGLLAGALGVGIGFGLQNIVANFISGLILTFERPIQTGDTIEVGTLMGNVINIGVRASTIQTFDGSEVIVPNSNLITHEVINWTLSDRKRRRDIEISAAYGTNPREVLEIIKKIANDHPSVIKNPGPWATFEGFGENALKFKVRFWVSLDIGLTVKSEVAMNIYDAFGEAGIQIPFPQQDLHIKSFDPTVQKTIFPGAKKKNKDGTEQKD
ncbi:MAG: mechanosensitive ion channel [Chlorobi bacterium]|nr:mechanosensitive ion channel [Chlorobiota bacterium]